MENKMANPAPLGLMGFGMTTVLLNIHNTGAFPMSSIILAMGIFYGGLAQILAGIMDYRNGNTFGTTAFTSYGAFWWTLVFAVYFNGKLGIPAFKSGFFAWYLFFWGIFTLFMWIGTFKTNRALQTVFLTLWILFFMLAAGEAFGLGNAWKVITGIEGIFCGLSAMYASLAFVLNETRGKTILPVGEIH
ncbi:MAG: hypothetical protein B6D63_05700 [Candidatus Latescibacteria bacterium 4484_7]|nr:MAG: hypothetical protein B6D63_05700 [Candidatus Latescibacteria bacterium 4484_7]